MTNENSLYSHFRPFLKRFVLALFFMAMVAFFTAFFAVIIQPVIDELFIQGGGRLAEKSKLIRNLIMRVLHIEESKMVLVLPQLLFVAFLGQAIFSFLSLYSMKTLGLKVVRNIRDKLYRHLIHQSIDFLSKARTGDPGRFAAFVAGLTEALADPAEGQVDGLHGVAAVDQVAAGEQLAVDAEAERAAEALAYNGLVQSWPEIVRLAREGGKPSAEQGALFAETEE